MIRPSTPFKYLWWGSANFIMLFISAYLAGSISSVVVFSTTVFKSEMSILTPFVVGLFGIAIASPILVFVFFPWMLIKNRNCNIFVYSSIPVISAAIYEEVIGFFESKDHFLYLLLFVSTAFFTCVFMKYFYVIGPHEKKHCNIIHTGEENSQN